MSMFIYAPEGHKVIVSEQSAQAGYDSDRKIIAELLTIGEVYSVTRTNVGRWATDVYLDGFPNIAFNSENFEDYAG